MSPRPKFITFDCYGTLTHFDMAGAARRIYGEALSEPAMVQFIKNFAAYRLDEVLALSDRCLALVEGRLLAIPAGADRAAIGAILLGREAA